VFLQTFGHRAESLDKGHWPRSSVIRALSQTCRDNVCGTMSIVAMVPMSKMISCNSRSA
jgi:hypothetical protein